MKPPRRARLHFHDKIQSTCLIAQAGLELAQGGQAGLRLAILLLQPLQGRDYSVHHAQLDPDF